MYCRIEYSISAKSTRTVMSFISPPPRSVIKERRIKAKKVADARPRFIDPLKVNKSEHERKIRLTLVMM
jgi:hypothetical protein